MKRFLPLMIYLPFLLLSCGGGSDAGTETETIDPSPADEDEWILRLSSELVADPQTQADKDRNDIINYAIDSMLDVRSTQSGLFYQVLSEGEGELLQWGDRIKVNYRGYFISNGREFDSSYRRGKPMEFYIGNMIAGWNEGLQLLRPGGRVKFLVPSHLAYKEEGVKDSKGNVLVPPNAVLAFDLEVLEVTERKSGR